MKTKTYNETVKMIAEAAACDWLGGGRGRIDGIDIVAFVFGADPADVKVDAKKAYELAVRKFAG